MSTWIRDSSGNLVNLDRYNQVILDHRVGTSSVVFAENHDEINTLFQGSFEDCKRYYDSLLTYLGFNIYIEGQYTPGKGGHR